MAKYKYYLIAGPYGGKHTIGTIPKKVAKYWLDKGADAFGEYMLDSNHDKINDTGRIPEEYQLPIWHKLDNISHMSSVVFCNSNFLTVLDVTNLDESLSLEEGQEIAKITMTDVMIGDSDFDAGKLLNLDNDCVQTLFLVFLIALEKMRFGFCEIEGDHHLSYHSQTFDRIPS